MSVKLKFLVSEDLVYFALNQLGKENLLENKGKSVDHFGSLSRRQVVQPVGPASMVILPVIASIGTRKSFTNLRMAFLDL